MKFLIPLLSLILMYGGQAWADCKSDCQNDYQSEVNSCRAQYNDPDGADDLQSCIDNAKSEYDSCLEDCETEASSTEGGLATLMVPTFRRWKMTVI
jgi:hypothetical protein